MGNDQLQMFNSTASQLNMSMINTRITQKDVGGTHQIKAISGASNECWWRAAWLSALIQHSQSDAPAVHLETTLVEKLGDQFSKDAKRITDMIKGIRKRGISAVMTNMYRGKAAEKMATESRLKLPHQDNDQNYTRGEDVCRRLTKALLAHAGTSEQTREKLFKDKEAGNEMVVATLCNELECDVVVHSKPWKETPFEVESVLVCPQPNSRLHALQAEAGNPDALTARLMRAVGQIPVITTRNGHFNLAIPAARAPA